MLVEFNGRRPKVTPLGLTTADVLFPYEDWKYASVDYVYDQTSPTVRAIIDAAPITGAKRHTLIDVKVQDLHPEICSCLPGWHFDGVPLSDDLHHLCVVNGPLTEFLADPIVLQIEEDMRLPEIPDLPVVKITEGDIHTFTSFDLHRGVYAKAPTRRLLVRITETDRIQPRNHPKAPAMGAVIR